MNNSKQHGATLIEILVSAFILSLGVLALTSMQVKSTSSIMEAKMNMLISHEAYRLGQNILTNPDFTKNGRDYAYRNYAHYNEKTCNYGELNDVTATTLSKTQMVDKHLFDFCSGILASTKTLEPKVKILVCEKDNFITDFKYNKDLTCGTNGNQTILKVSWGLDDASFANTYQLILPQEIEKNI